MPGAVHEDEADLVHGVITPRLSRRPMLHARAGLSQWRVTGTSSVIARSAAARRGNLPPALRHCLRKIASHALAMTANLWILCGRIPFRSRCRAMPGFAASLFRYAVAAALLALAGSPTRAQAQQLQDIVIALPAYSLSFSFEFIAEDMGLYEKHG